VPTSSRSLLAIVALPLLVLGYTANLGFYSPLAIALVLAGAALVFVAALARPRALSLPPATATVLLYAPVTVLMVLILRQAAVASNGLLAMLYAVLAVVAALVCVLAHLAGLRPRDPLTAAMVGVGILLSGQAALTGQLRYPDPLHWAAGLGIMAAGVMAYGVWLSFLAQPHPGRGWRIRLGLLLLTGVALRGLAVAGSPDPIIDANAWLQQAPRFLLAGRNPYAADYASPYGTDRARAAGINDAPDARPATYPPLAILTGLPTALLGLDGRYVNVVADVLAALLIFLAARGRPQEHLGLLAAGLYLCLPRTPFMIEQGWFEPQMAALVGVWLWQAGRMGTGGPAEARPLLTAQGERGAATWAGLALGGLVAAKQLSLALLPVVIVACWGRKRTLLTAAVVAAAVILPFVLWGPGDFWQIVVAKHLARPVIPHALTLLALAKQGLGLDLPPILGWSFAAAMIALITWRGPRQPVPGLGLWLAAALLAFVLGHKQGYFNYYVLAAYLLLWGGTDGDTEGVTSR
jgi:hypothetical protein